ncbi:MAG TPA: hypothetical protein VGF99_07745 [Myxococcota bacterium]
MPALPALLPAIDAAIADAVGLARMRGGRLTSIVLAAPGGTDVGAVVGAVAHALGRHAIDASSIEIRQQAGERVRLVAVEIVPAAPS